MPENRLTLKGAVLQGAMTSVARGSGTGRGLDLFCAGAERDVPDNIVASFPFGISKIELYG